MDEIAGAIAAAVEEQDKTTQEIARNTQEAARGTHEVTRTISGIKESVGETGTAAAKVLRLAKDLGRTAATLRSEVDGFLVEIRVA